MVRYVVNKSVERIGICKAKKIGTRGPFYWRGLTWILAWISNYTYDNVWFEITY